MHPWRGGARASMAERGKLTGELSKKAGDAVPQRRWRRGSGLLLRRGGAPASFGRKGAAVVSCGGRREGKGAGRKKSLPRSPIYRRGVVTAPVTTPPGSPVASGSLWPSCGRASARVGKTQEGHRILCAARARDLRRQRGSGWERSLPSGSGQGAGSVM